MHNWDNITVISLLINTASPMKKCLQRVWLYTWYSWSKPMSTSASSVSYILNDHDGQITIQVVYILNTVMINNYNSWLGLRSCIAYSCIAEVINGINIHNRHNNDLLHRHTFTQYRRTGLWGLDISAQKCVAMETNNSIIVKILYICSLLYFSMYQGNISFQVSGAHLCNRSN